MGPQPPLKRRPTYTRPCKRDISAKLTPVGVHPHTRTGAKSQAIILLVDRYIYIYIYAHIYIYIYIYTRTSIPWPRIDTSLSQASTYFDHYRLISTLCSPWSAHRNSPCFPRIFSISNFSTVTRASSQFDPFSILMPPRVFLPFYLI